MLARLTDLESKVILARDELDEDLDTIRCSKVCFLEVHQVVQPEHHSSMDCVIAWRARWIFGHCPVLESEVSLGVLDPAACVFLGDVRECIMSWTKI